MVWANELAAAILAHFGILIGILADFRRLSRSGIKGLVLIEDSWFKRSCENGWFQFVEQN